MDKPVAEHECLSCGHSDYRMSTSPLHDLVVEACPKCNGDMVIQSRNNLPSKFKKIINIIGEDFHICDFQISEENMNFSVEREREKNYFSNILEKLQEMDYLVRLDEKNNEINIAIQKMPEVEKSNIWINIILFLATIGTTFGVAGYWYLYDGNILKAALFSGSLLTILGAHELGHKIQTWRNNVKASWPYFLPIPHPLLGTFGAVIKNKTPIPSRDGLAEIGATGPVLGFLFALPMVIIGLNFSQPFGAGVFQEVFQGLPTPLIFILIGEAIFGEFPQHLSPHPLAWAGFIGIFVTWLNLIPTGQLDGGHIARSFMNQKNHYLLTRGIGFGLLFFSLIWPGFLILALLILFFVGRPHPGALDEISEMSRKGKLWAIFGLIIFILSIPIPLWAI